MKQCRYEELQAISRAVVAANSDGRFPSVLATQDITITLEIEHNTFNLRWYVELTMDKPENPYIQICDSTGGIQWGGYLSALQETKEKWKEPYEKMFEPDFVWFLTNEYQVLPALECPDKGAEEAVEKALKILRGDAV